MKMYFSYGELIRMFGETRFREACAESKASPLSVQEILERDDAKRLKTFGELVENVVQADAANILCPVRLTGEE